MYFCLQVLHKCRHLHLFATPVTFKYFLVYFLLISFKKRERRVEKTKTTNKRKNDFIAMKQSTLKTYLLEKYLDIYF